jgi:hypothetical protein
VNFYIAADPLLAIGSIAARTAPPHYDWHCYLDDPAAGSAPDLATAEAELRRAIACRRRNRQMA